MTNLESERKKESEVVQLCPTLCDSMDCRLPGSSGNSPWSFSGKSTGVGLPFPSPGDLPDPGMEPGSSALQTDALSPEPQGSLMTNLDSILKSRDITLSIKVCLVKAMVFPVVMYECESWAIKKAEHQRIVVFELWCWRRLLRVPWTARRSNQSVLKEISPGCSLEGLMLKLKLQSFDHLM